MYKPLVSIIIPVYNGSNYLKESIDSALAQTYKNIEVIIVNDGSNDNGATEEIALSYGDKIKYISKENGGVSSALNVGIQNMKGEWFSWLSHDDLYTEDKIEKQVAFLNKKLEENNHFYLNKNVIMCDSCFIDKDGNYLKRRTKNISKIYLSGNQMLLEVFNGYSIGGCALLVPQKCFKEFGIFNEEVEYMQDLDMWYRLMVAGINFHFIDEKMSLTRVHANQATVLKKNLGEKDRDIVGMWLSENLFGRYVGEKYLLEEYLYMCLKRNSLNVAKHIKYLLKKEGKLSFFISLKAIFYKVYGNIRPNLVKLYYKMLFNINIK